MSPEKLVALHQPNFFPWLGYFDKLVRADRFVMLDNVQFSKTGGTWSNRVRLISGGEARWVTAPVVRAYSGVRLIRDMQFDDAKPWRRKMLESLRASYGRAPHFETVFPEMARLIGYESGSLLDFNLHAIVGLCQLMGIETNKIVLGSTLDVDGRATEMLVASVQAVGGTTYLCGGGADGYQQDEAFRQAGLQLRYQHFQHPVYAQDAGVSFVPGLSCIDALMHCGFSGTRALVGQ